MSVYRQDPPPDVIREMVYHKDGVLYYFENVTQNPTGQRRDTTKPLGNYDKDGYLVKGFTIDGVRRNYKVHRLIHWLETGEWPPVVDHRNGIPDDNRPCNLRSSNHTQNSINRKKQINNKSGFVGVCKKHDGYRATIAISGNPCHIAGFHDAKHAALMRDLLAWYVYGEDAKFNFLGKVKIRINGELCA